MNKLLTATLALALGLAATPVRAAEIRVLTAGAYKGVLTAMAPGFEQRTGHRLVIANDTAGGVLAKVRAGEAVDAVILTPAGVSSLGELIQPESSRELARVGIAVAVRDGAPKPDVSTSDGIRAAVVNARAPAWIDPAAGGSSGIYMDRLWERWGIATLVLPKAVLVNGGLVADRLLDGSADLAFQQASELSGVPGVTVVGLLPAAIQNYTTYAGAVTARAAEPAAAAALLDYLAGPAAAVPLASRGMETPRGKQ